MTTHNTASPCADEDPQTTRCASGEWPHTPHADALLAQVRYERARFEVTLGAIRAALEEEPSPAAIRACARRWHDAITHLADELIAARKNTEAAA